MNYLLFIIFLKTQAAIINVITIHIKTIIIGIKKSEYILFIPIKLFLTNKVVFLKGSIFIILIIPPLNPSTGNHIPDNNDWHDIKIEVTNTNTEYFDVTSRVIDKKISPKNGKTNIEVEVELIKLPINKDQKSNIGIKISAEPIK